MKTTQQNKPLIKGHARYITRAEQDQHEIRDLKDQIKRLNKSFAHSQKAFELINGRNHELNYLLSKQKNNGD